MNKFIKKYIKNNIKFQNKDMTKIEEHLLKLNDILKSKEIGINKHNKIKEYLNKEVNELDNKNNFNTKLKGDIFEYFIAYLYLNNIEGEIEVEIVGGKDDGGIDIQFYILKNEDGGLKKSIVKYIQCKNYKKPLSRKEVVAEIENFDYKLSDNLNIYEEERKYQIISLNGYTKEVMESDIKFNNILIDFDDNDIKTMINNFNTKESKELISFSTNLKPHNLLTYKKINLLKEKYFKIATIQPTGTGKMYIMNQIMLDNQNKKILILTPNLIIIEKLKKLNCNINKNIVYSTNMGINNVKNKQNIDDFDIIIVDEYHRIGAKQTMLELDSLIKGQSKLKNIFGFTATPKRNEIDKKTKEKIDMTDWFDVISNELSIEECMVDGILQIPNYISALYDMKGVKIDKVFVEYSEKIDNSSLKTDEKSKLKKRLEDSVIDLKEDKTIDKIISEQLKKDNRCIRKENIKFIVFVEGGGIDEEDNNLMETTKKDFDYLIADKLKKQIGYNIVNSYKVHSKYNSFDTTYNKEQIEKFEKNKRKGSVDFLFNVNMLNEGYHINDITGVILLRKTHSEILYKQQIGRIFSAGDENKNYIFDFVNNYNNLNKNMKEVSFLNNLEKEKQKVFDKRKRLGFKDDEEKNKKIKNNLCEYINKKEIKIIGVNNDFIDILDIVNNSCKKSKTFEERMIELEEFIKLNKRLPKQNSKEKEEKSLAGFIGYIKNKNILEQMNIYNGLIEKYDIEKNIKTFEERIIEFEEFIKLNKRLPKNYSKDNDEKSLAGFISRIKRKNILEQMNIYNGLIEKYDIEVKVKAKAKTFEERMIELEDFLKLNKRLPKNHSKDNEEKSLAGYLNGMKNRNILEQMNIYNSLLEKYDIEVKERKRKQNKII